MSRKKRQAQLKELYNSDSLKLKNIRSTSTQLDHKSLCEASSCREWELWSCLSDTGVIYWQTQYQQKSKRFFRTSFHTFYNDIQIIWGIWDV